MKNFTFKREWMEEMAALPDDFRARIVLAANDYAYFDKLPDDPIVAYAMRHIIAYIKRRKAAKKRVVSAGDNVRPEIKRRPCSKSTASDVVIANEIYVDSCVCEANARRQEECRGGLESECGANSVDSVGLFPREEANGLLKLLAVTDKSFGDSGRGATNVAVAGGLFVDGST